MPVDLQIDAALVEAGCDIEAARLDCVVDCVAETLNDDRVRAEVCVRICDSEESRQLNATYRGKDKPTNVLSFAADMDLPAPAPLGDLAICWSVVLEEAREQNKTVADHFCHLVVHGLLHLLGYDHVDDADAAEMERLEVAVLGKLGIDNPYLIVE